MVGMKLFGLIFMRMKYIVLVYVRQVESHLKREGRDFKLLT